MIRNPASLAIAGVLVAAHAQESPLIEIPAVLPESGAIKNAPDPWAALEEPVVPSPPTVTFDPPPASWLLPPRAVTAATHRFETIRCEGNRSFSNEALTEVTAAFLNRPLDPTELDNVREAITRHYITAGFVSSGAKYPDQDLRSGELRIEITEGRLNEVILRGNRALDDRYLKARVMGQPDATLHFPSLQKRLQVLQGNPNIARVQAELRPGETPGESYVDLFIEENPRWSYGVDVNNYLPPSAGSEQAELWLENRNLTGFSDTLTLRYGVFSGGLGKPGWSGADNLVFSYLLPVSRYDTALELTANRQGYAIIEEPFAELGIEGESSSIGLGLRHPLIRNVEDGLWTNLSLTVEHSETTLSGEPFSVSPGYVDGQLDLTVASWGMEWTRRKERQVIILGSRLAAGLSALGATDSDQAADAAFLAWITSGQYLRRLNEAGHLLSVRGFLQLADDALPSSEQAALGGPHSVRGYRQNEIVRDMAFSIGAEYRIPLAESGPWNINLVPFVDGGTAWNRVGGDADTLLAIGCGITATYRDIFRGELFYGYPLLDGQENDGNLQDDGVYFQLSLGRF